MGWRLGWVAAFTVAWGLGCGPGVAYQSAQGALGSGPNAVFTADVTSGAAPLSVYFEGTHSTPAGDGSWIATCKLEYGDGTSTTNCWGLHSYAAGSWTARFTVTDNLGRSAVATQAVTANGPGTPDGGAPDAGPPDSGSPGPTVVFTADTTSGTAPLSVYFEGSTSKAAPGSWVSTCKLDYGDGASTTNCWGLHSYAAGIWTARFTVTDNLGRSASATKVISSRAPGGADAGTSDAGAPADAGSTTDAGSVDAGPVVSAPPGGWQFFGATQGGPQQVLGASSDAAGNIWVAGGDEGLFLLAPGASAFRRFTVADGLTGFNDGVALRNQRVISVAGGPANTVFVGYQGQPGCTDAFERYNFNTAYQAIWKSGDADRVTLAGSGLQVVHYDISSGPGVVAAEPQGRERICTVLRIAYHAGTQSVWFGGNHGVAWGSAISSTVVEHTHPAINGYIASGSSYQYTLLTDLYYGLAPLPNGDVWLGGANRSALFRWATLGQSFWNADAEIERVMVDLWPDAVPADSYPQQRRDDNVSDMAALADRTVWASSISNGLVHWTPAGPQYLRITAVEPSSKATSLEVDPQDGSLWVGFIWGGLARLQPGQTLAYDWRIFGSSLSQAVVPDIQSDAFGGHRRILVAFDGQGISPSAVGIYTGQ